MVDFFFSTTKVRNPPGILRIILTICLLLADFVRNDAANLMLSNGQPPADAQAERRDALAEREVRVGRLLQKLQVHFSRSENRYTVAVEVPQC